MSEAIVAPAENRGFLATLLDVFIAPGDAFRAIARRPEWVAPFILAVGVGVAFSAIWTQRVDPYQFMKAQMEESGAGDRIPAEKRGDVLRTQAKFFTVFSWIGPLVFAPLAYVALAGLLLFVYRFFYAADVTFPQSMAVVAWCMAAFGLVLNPLILLVMALKGEWNVDPHSVVQASGAALVDKAATSHVLYALLGSLDIFSFWLIALLSIGYAAVLGTRARTAAWPIVALWLVIVLCKCGMAAIF
jgi:Yip1-like protein